MNLWNRARLAARVAYRSFSLAEQPSKDPALAALFGWRPTHSGINVSETTALNYSAVWAAVNIIAGQIASLPLHLYRRDSNGGRERVADHPVARLYRQPNDEMTSMVFRETLLAHVLTWGNAYAEIERTRAGRPVALWPLNPSKVRPDRDRAKRVVYTVAGQPQVRSENIYHLPGLGFDGLVGYSVIRMARESIGLGLATEAFGSAFFGNGAWPGLVATHPETLGEEAHKNLTRSLNEKHQGVDNSHRLIVLEEGMKVEKVGIPPEDAQFLETRKFQVVEVARWFNIAPHKLKDLDRATFSNIEHQNIDHVTDTLRPWMVRAEQECDRKLLGEGEREAYYSEHLADALLRGDIRNRYSAYAVGRQWGWLSADDIREKENMNPLPDDTGKIYLVPVNMTAADRLLDPPQEETSVTATNTPAERAAPTRNAALAEAQRQLVIETMARMVRKEGNALRRAVKHGTEGLRTWMNDFYPRHMNLLKSVLLPVVRAQLVAAGSPKDPAVVAWKLASAYVRESRGAVGALAASGAAELDRHAEALATRWAVERPGVLAEALMQEERNELPEAA
jgi:HK97 family phage portal protein